MTLSCFMYCCLIPSIRHSPTVVCRLMTDCLRLPDTAVCWVCHSTWSHLYADEIHTHAHTHLTKLCRCTGLLLLQFQVEMLVCGEPFEQCRNVYPGAMNWLTVGIDVKMSMNKHRQTQKVFTQPAKEKTTAYRVIETTTLMWLR